MSDSRQLNIRVNLDTGKLERDAANATNTLKGIGNEAETQGKRMTGVFKNVGAGLAAAFAVVRVKNFIGEIINVRSEIQSLSVSFETLLGSKEKADELFGQIRRYAANTPMQMNDLAQGAQTLLGFNIEAKKVMPIMQAIGDISMGNRDKFNSLTLAFAQMSATGKLMGQDLLQMINAGFNPLTVISDQTGKSISTLKDEMSAGSISAKMIEDAFIAATAEGGKFHGMLDQQSKTLRGSISNLQGAFTDMLNDFGESSEGIIAGGVNAAYTMVKNYKDTAEALLVLIGVVGAYKAALIVNQALEAAALDTAHAKVAAIGAVNAAQATGFELEVQQAVAKRALTKAEAEELLMQYELAKARVADLTALKVQSLAEKESAIATQAAAAAKVQAAEQQVIAANMKYEAALRSGNGEKIERAELALGTAQSELNAASKAHMTAMTNTAVASKKASVAATTAETAAQQLNTLSMNTGSKAAGFLTLAKTQLLNTTRKLYATMAANPLGLILAAVIALGYGIYKLATYQTEAEKIADAHKQTTQNLELELAKENERLEDLNNTLKTSKKGSEDWKEAKDELVSQYGKYLNGIDSEIERVGYLGESYKKLTEAVQQSVAARQIAKFQEDNAPNHDELIKSITEKLSGEVVLSDLSRDKNGRIVGNRFRKTKIDKKTQKQWIKALIKNLYQGDDSGMTPMLEDFLRNNKSGVFSMDNFGAEVFNARKTQNEYDAYLKDLKEVYGYKETSDENKTSNKVVNGDELDKKIKEKKADLAKHKKDSQEYKELVKEINTLEKERAQWGSESDLKQKKSSGMTSEQIAAKEENAAAKLADILRKQGQERLRIEQDYEYERWQSRINLMQEGEAKVLEQQRLDFDKEKTELGRRLENELEAELNRQMAVFNAEQDALAAGNRKYAKKTFRDSDIDESAMKAIRDRYALLQDDLTKAQRKAEADRIQAAKESFNAYLKEFGSYQQKREAIEAEYDKRIAEATTAGERMMLEAQKRKAQSDLDYQQWVDSGDIALAFGDISTLSRQTIDRLIEDMERYRSKVVATFDPEKIAKYEEALSSLRNADINGSFGIFADSIPEYFKQRKSVSSQLDSAGQNVNALYERRAELYNRIIDLQQRYNAAKAVGEDTAALQKELISAKTELDANTTATDNAVNAFRRLQEQWDALNTPEAKFTALATSVATVAGLVAGLSGQMSEMADALGAEGLGEALGYLGDAMGSISNIASAFAKGDIIGGIAAAAGAAMNLVTKLAMAGDARHQRNIEALQKRIDALDRSCDKLGKSISKAYSYDASALIGQQETLLRQQKALVQQQLAEEEAKKKTDDDKVRQYREQIEDLDEAIADAKESAKDAIFGDDLKSQIEDFASAYSEAWSSGESRVMSARDTVRKMMRQMAEESIKAAIQGSGAMERIRQTLADFYSDNILTAGEQDYIYGLADELQKELDARFGQQADLLSDTYSQNPTAKGWDTFTQDQADVLTGRFTAFCETSEAIRGINAGIAESVKSSLLLASAQRDLMQDALNIHIVNMGHLEAISKNTRELATIREDLGKIERYVRNL